MGKCVATFQILGTDYDDISVTLNSDEKNGVSLIEISQSLIRSGQRNNFVKILQDIGITKEGRKVKVKDIKVTDDKGKGKFTNDLMYNYTYAALRTKYTLPESKDPDYNPKILFRKSFTRTATNDLDILFSDGTMIIGGSKESLDRLRTFIRLRNGIYNYYENNNTNEKVAELRKQVEEKLQKTFRSEKEFLYDYLTHNSEYQKDRVLYAKIHSQIVNFTKVKTHDFTKLPDMLVSSYATEITDRKGFYKLSISNFLHILEQVSPEDYRQFVDQEGKRLPLSKIMKKEGSEEQKDSARKLILDLFNKIPLTQFICKGISVTDSTITIRTSVGTLSNTSSFEGTYNTINQLVKFQSVYKGFQIYARNNDGVIDYFYANQQGLSPKMRVNKYYSTIEECFKAVDSIVETDTFKNSWHPEFRSLNTNYLITKFESKETLYPGHIIKILNIPINTRVLDSRFSTIIRGNYTLANFIQLFGTDSTKVSKTIDSIESAAILAYLLSEKTPEDQSKYTLDEALDIISKAKSENNYKTYFVTDFDKEKGYNSIYVFDMEGDVEEEVGEKKPEPIIRQLQSLADWFEEKFGVPTEVVTNSEFNSYSPEGAERAIYRDGKVILNGQTASTNSQLFEYSVLILQAIKSQYKGLYDYIRQTAENMDWFPRTLLNQMDRIKSDQNTDPDVIRETAIDAILAQQLKKMFKQTTREKIFDGQVEKQVEEVVRTIVDDGKTDIGQLYKRTLANLFQNIFSYKKEGAGLLPSTLKITDVVEEDINKKFNQNCG